MSNSTHKPTGLLLLLGVLAILVVWLATPFGIGINPDSTVYLDAANNLLNGRGLIALTASGEFRPLTHYPPVYPALLTLLARGGSLFGGFPIGDVARVLNSLVFGANVFLVGIAIRSYVPNSYWLPIIGSSLTLTAPDIAGIHTFALTEGLFVFLLLSGLVLLFRFTEIKRRRWLIMSAVLVALAWLTRYVGVTLVFTGVVVLLFVNGRTFRQRSFDALTFGLIACAPMALWAVRNMRAAGGMTDREFSFHPVRLRQLAAGLSTFSSWLLLGNVRTEYRIICFVLELVVGSLVVIYLFRRTRNARARHDHTNGETTPLANMNEGRSSSSFPIILMVFIVSFVSFLIFTAFFIDADTVLDRRALVPVHVGATVLVCGLVSRGIASLGEARSIQIAFVAFVIMLIGSYSIRSAQWFMQARQDGQGYASRSWKESATIAHIRNAPPGVPVYSNGYDAIYYLTGRPAIYVPEIVIHGTGRPNQNYAAEVWRMQKALDDSKGFLVYFNTLPERWFLPSESDLTSQILLSKILASPDGSIYEVSPSSEERSKIEVIR